VQLIQEVSITATDWLVFAEFQEAVLMPIVPGMIRCAPGRYKEVKPMRRCRCGPASWGAMVIQWRIPVRLTQPAYRQVMQ
jgi:hypothetical protein